MSDDSTPPQMPQPHPALARLDFLVGNWEMKGQLLGSDEENVTGQATFEWMPGGFFLRQRVNLDFAGSVKVDSEEIIGYDPETDSFPSTVFANMSPVPLPYTWEVADGSMKISVSHGPLDATFNGTVSETGDVFSGGWRPNPGADETVNVPYDIKGSKVS